MIVEMRNIYFALIICILSISSCHTRSRVSQVWNYIQDRPDSALVVLNAMDASAFHGRTLAEYRLLKAMALDKNYVNIASDSLAKPAYQYFRKHGPKDKEMMSLYYMALSHYYASECTEAILLLDDVTRIAGAQGDYYYLGLGHIARSYAFLGTYCVSEAVKSAELGVAAFKKLNNSVQVQRAKLQLADAYHASKEFEKALSVYQELIHTCQKDTFTMRRALIHAAYSLYREDSKQADSAMRYYERALYDYRASMSSVEAAHFGEVATMTGNTQLAHRIVEQLKALNQYPAQRAYLEYKLYAKENKPWDALIAIEDYLTLQDTIIRVSLEQSLIKTQRDYQEQKKLSAEQSLLLTRLIGGTSSLCLLLILLMVTMYYTRKRREAAEEKEELISSLGETVKLLQETEKINSELEGNLQMAQKRYIAAYKKQFSKISSIIANYYSSSGEKNGRDIVYKQVMEIAATIGNDQTRMSALEREVNAALDNAMKWYREEFPRKTPTHYSMVCLFMAGFTTPLLEIMTGVPKNTLYSKKSRILEEIRNSDVEHKDSLLMAIK